MQATAAPAALSAPARAANPRAALPLAKAIASTRPSRRSRSAPGSTRRAVAVRYRAWVEAGGDLFCHYSSVVNWSKWGSWGLLRYHDQPPGTSPKFMATMGWARSLGQRVKTAGE